MGYMYYGETSRSNGFSAIELTGRFYLEKLGMKSFTQILLLNKDQETLLYVKQHLNRVVNNAVMIKRHEYNLCGTDPDEFKEFCRKFEPLIDTIIMKPETDLLSRMTSSLKRAILSIAIDRCNADRTTICNALGLSDRQLEEELRLCGLRISDKRDKP